jgi:transcriptional/translational regulatory protein YebC/TACO1
MRKKGANDAMKAKVFVKLGEEIASASRACGGDMENTRLATAVYRARSIQMPRATLEAAVERGASGKGPTGDYVKYEGIGPANVSIIVEGLTDNRNRTGSVLRHLFSKYGGALQSDGSAAWIFDQLGCLQIRIVKDTLVTRDEIFSCALDAGATDVEFTEAASENGGEAGQCIARVITYVSGVQLAREALTAAGHPPSLVEFIWSPKSEENCI